MKYHLTVDRLQEKHIREFLMSEYGIGGKISFHQGEHDVTVIVDRTYLNKPSVVLKIAGPTTDLGFFDAKVQVIQLLNKTHGKIHPGIIPTTHTDCSTLIEIENEDYLVYLMEFAEGTPLQHNKNIPKPLLWDIGHRLALMNRTMADIDDTNFKRQYHWAPHSADAYIKKYWSYIPTDVQHLISQAMDISSSSLRSSIDLFQRQVIHSDANDQNIFYHRRSVTGIIDLGDAVKSFRICELANCITYLLPGRSPLVGIIAHVTRGYVEAIPLPKVELNAIIDFILIRLALSLSIGYFNEATHPRGKELIESRAALLSLLRTLLSDPNLIETCRKAVAHYAK